MSIYINHNTNDISTNAGARVTSGGNTVITTNEAATDAAAGIVELATTAEVQTGTDTGRVPSVSSLRGGLIVSGTAIATTSGTSHDFTGIPSWATRVIMLLSGVSTNGTSVCLIQLGGSGGIETTGYVSTSCQSTSTGNAMLSSTAGHLVGGGAAADTRRGRIIFEKLDGNTWIGSGGIAQSTTYTTIAFSTKTLSGTLTQIRLTTVNGTDTFDAGSVNILYE